MVFVGGSVGLGAIAFGWVGMSFGLGLWATISAIAVGTVVGQILLVPLILIGSKTATNNATSSGATFGVRGRLIGSGIGLLTTLFSVALTVWTSASAGVGVAGRLFGDAGQRRHGGHRLRARRGRVRGGGDLGFPLAGALPRRSSSCSAAC